MKIIPASVEIISPIDGAEVLRHLERCGRVCYKSEHKITENSAPGFVAGLIARGHESVLEHFSFTACFIANRGVTHEIVRHRLASYSQESTRYCLYSDERFGEELTVIKPCFFDQDTDRDLENYLKWECACRDAEDWYKELIRNGAKAQEARDILPHGLKSELIMTANLREWRHFFKLRCDAAAHPQMREVARMLLKEAHEKIPVVFDDLAEKYL